jgi:acyl carrier protein
LLRWLREQLAVPPELLDADVPLPRLGLESMMALDLSNRIQERFGRAVPVPDILGGLSLNDLVAILMGAMNEPAVSVSGAASQGAWVTGEI